MFSFILSFVGSHPDYKKYEKLIFNAVLNGTKELQSHPRAKRKICK